MKESKLLPHWIKINHIKTGTGTGSGSFTEGATGLLNTCIIISRNGHNLIILLLKLIDKQGDICYTLILISIHKRGFIII